MTAKPNTKYAIIAFLTALFGVFGYAIVNYERLDLVRALGVGLGAVVLIGCLGVALVAFFKELNKLEKMP